MLDVYVCVRDTILYLGIVLGFVGGGVETQNIMKSTSLRIEFLWMYNDIKCILGMYAMV